MIDLSVGELLIEANRSIRNITWDIGSVHARGVLAGWPDLAQAARRVLDLLPVAGQRTWVDVANFNPVTKAQTATPLPAFVDAARLLNRAGDLLDAYAPPVGTDEAGTKVARASVLLGLCTAAHTSAVALGGHIDAETARRLPYVPHGVMPGLCRQFKDLEAALIDENTRSGLGRIRDDTPQDDSTLRIGQSLSRWRMAATATLEGLPTRDDVQCVAQTEARLNAYAAALGAAAQTAGVVTGTEAAMLNKSLADARRGWETISAAWPKHIVERRPCDPGLVDESKNVRAALDTVTRDGIGWAQPHAIAGRVDLPVVLADVRTAMRGSQATAEQLAKLPGRLVENDALHGYSRGLAATLAASPTGLTGQALADTLVNKLIPLRDEHLPALVAPAKEQVHLVGNVVAATENLPDGRMAGLTRPAAALVRDDGELQRLQTRVRAPSALARESLDTTIHKRSGTTSLSEDRAPRTPTRGPIRDNPTR